MEAAGPLISFDDRKHSLCSALLRCIAECELRGFVNTSLQSKNCVWHAWCLIVVQLSGFSTAYRVQGLAPQLLAI